MTTTGEKKQSKRVLLLDADILGFAAGAFVGAAVMAVGFFRLQLPAFDIAVRTGLTFVVTYAAVFLLVKFLISTMLREVVEKRRREYEEQLKVQEAKGNLRSPQGEPRPTEQDTGEGLR